jgi:serine/threonine-protein kinase
MIALPDRDDAELARSIGITIEGRYRVTGLIGQTGTALILAARSLGGAIADHGIPDVVLKVLCGRAAGAAGEIARFTQEAFLAARLSHPNLVRCIDFGRLSDRRPYFVMERCEGRPLDRLVRRGRVPPRIVALIVEEAACGLEALHAHGIAHCDIKPGNLLWARRPPAGKARLRILDLGIAQIFDRARSSELGELMAAPAGESLGTPGYVAPEQALGRRVDPRADVYSLGCVAYHLLTGRAPFPFSSTAERIRGQLLGTVEPASQVNPALPGSVDAVLAAALEKHPSRRPTTAARLAAELIAAIARRPARLRATLACPQRPSSRFFSMMPPMMRTNASR